MSPAPLSLLLLPLSQDGQFSSREHRWVLVSEPPSPNTPTCAVGTGSVGPRLPAAWWDATKPGWPAWEGTEALLSQLSGPAGTIATLRTRNIGQHDCPGSYQATTTPFCATPTPSPLLWLLSLGDGRCQWPLCTGTACFVPDPCCPQRGRSTGSWAYCLQTGTGARPGGGHEERVCTLRAG